MGCAASQPTIYWADIEHHAEAGYTINWKVKRMGKELEMEPEQEINPEQSPAPVEPAAETESSRPVEMEANAAGFDQTPIEPAAETVESAVEEVAGLPAAASLGTAPRQLVGEPHPKKKFWSKVLPWVIVAALFYLGGLATIYFALYQPQKQADKAALAELSASATASAEADANKIIDLTNNYNQALKQYGEAQTELDLTKGELEATRNTVIDKDAELAKANLSNLAYKFLVDVSSARAAVEKADTATARQAINFAKADLEALKAANVTADVISGFAEKLNEASSNLTPSGIAKTRTALDSLYSNLLLFIDNLP
ncbi:MAG TPA: hypothetical protein PK883_00300 [Anaerolineaceae bacterium]|nr:hypothetical protein [Anaerolineaceae bacterium]